MITNPRKKEMMVNLRLFKTHAQLVAMSVQRFPENKIFRKNLEEIMGIVSDYERRINF